MQISDCVVSSGVVETASVEQVRRRVRDIESRNDAVPWQWVEVLGTWLSRVTAERLGPPTLLVNNAGIAQLGRLGDVEIDDWCDVLTVNLRAPVVWIKAVLPIMCEQQRGRILNISSPAATNPLPYISSYGAAKAGLTQFTACFAPEVAPDGIAVIALGPTALTDMTRSLWETDGLPPDMQEQFKTAFTADPKAFMRMSLETFRCAATGGADHLSGLYIGQQPDGFDTPQPSPRCHLHSPASS